MAKLSKRKEIIEKSAQLFREKGYAASSVRDIAQAVGLEPSSLYSHINSKEDLLYGICMQCAAHYNNAMDEVCNNKKLEGIEKLKSVLEIHIDLALNDPTSSTVFSDEWKHLPEEKLKTFISERKDYEHKFTAILLELMNGNVIKKIDTYILMNTLISATRWLHHSKKKYSVAEKIEIKNLILDTLIKAVE